MKRATCVILCALLIIPETSFALEPKITDLLVTSAPGPGDVLVYFRAINCFTNEMEEAVFAGIPVTFTYTAEIYQERNFWTDKLETHHEIRHTIKYDNVKRLFFVSSSEKGKNTEQFAEFSKAKAAMTDVNGATVAEAVELQRGKKYYLRAKAEMEKTRLPLGLEYVFFFVSLWDFETAWARQDFVY
jgi:hypothetical protein